MEEKCNNEKFIEITNKDIYDMICSIKETIDGNGKKGLKEKISNNALNIKIQYGLVSILVLAILKDLVMKWVGLY